MRFRHTEFDDTVNVTQEHPLYSFAKYGIASILVVAVIYLCSGLLVDTLAEQMDTETEIWIGEKIETQDATKTPEFLRSQQRYMQALLASIPKDGLPPLPYRIEMVEEDAPNAGALPGGLIRVHSGLLKMIPSENGLAFVLGHELGHYANRDHLKGLGRGLVFAVLSLALLGEDRAAANLMGGMLNLSTLHYSRGQEEKADLWGLKLLSARYGHIGGAEDFFTAIHDKTGGLPQWASFISTHPLSENRISTIHTVAKRLGYPSHRPKPQPYYDDAFTYDVH